MCDYCSWIDQILAKVYAEVKSRHRKPPERVDPIIIVHGGAGRIPSKEREYMMKEVKNAAIQGYTELINGGSALDSIEYAICHMETKKYFNCGRGGSLDANGEVVMDAGIMSTNYECGFVGAVRDIEHPITLAKKVLQNSSHVLIVEKGAQRFATSMDIPILPPGSLLPEQTPGGSVYSAGEEEGENEEASVIGRYDPSYYDDYVGDWAGVDKRNMYSVCPPSCAKEKLPIDFMPSVSSVCTNGEEELPHGVHSTVCGPLPIVEPIFLEVNGVGAVAYDRKRRVASGTSTAGQPGKLIGSVSASGTIPGCGVYVNENGGASVSGEDKSIYTFAPARKIVRRLEAECIDNALKKEVQNFEHDTGETSVGAIAINSDGECYVHFKCQHFPWAMCYNGYIYFGCSKNERHREEVDILERPLDCMCESTV